MVKKMHFVQKTTLTTLLRPIRHHRCKPHQTHRYGHEMCLFQVHSMSFLLVCKAGYGFKFPRPPLSFGRSALINEARFTRTCAFQSTYYPLSPRWATILGLCMGLT